MKFKKILLLLFVFVISYAEQQKPVQQDSVVANISNIVEPDAKNKKLKIIVCSNNNASSYAEGVLVCEKNIRSIFAQTYEYFEVIYIDDCSSDGTAQHVEQVVAELGEQDRFTLIKNDKRCGHLDNQYNAIWSCDSTDVMVIVDGDDWLLDKNTFKLVNAAYQDPDIWLTYGNFKRIPYESWAMQCQAFPKSVVKRNAYRKHEWVSSHLRTFYAGLFMLIDKKDLMHEGDFWPAAVDLAVMFPMLEMANGRHRFIRKFIYAYNRENPLNLCTGPRLAIQNECARLIRLKDHYQPIDRWKMFEIKTKKDKQ